MLNINFVPDDYVQSNESRRTNLMYFVLLGVVMAGLVGSFVTIKMRQRAYCAQERLINTKLTQIQEAIKQFEELQTKRKTMMKAALTTAELLEPVPRSILLASLTNSLPPGVSLLKLSLVQNEPKQTNRMVGSTNKYQAMQAKIASEQPQDSQEKFLETNMEIEGIASSDLQVAAYIEQLSASVGLLDNVALVESKEHKIGGGTFRRFKLTAMLKKDVHLTKDDIKRISTKDEKTGRSF